MDKQIYSVSIDEIIPIIRERLSVGKSARFSPRGISMLPMLRQGIDSVVISPINGDIKKYDLALYMRDNGKYILHRVIETGSTYTCIGDNQFIPEKNINKDQFIGVVTEFYRENKLHSTDDLSYKIYCRLWCHSRGLRHFWCRGIGWIKRHFN